MLNKKKKRNIKPFNACRAHGYTYTNYSSYNPVSRQPSERQSVSSGKTGSDTMSMSGSSM